MRLLIFAILILILPSEKVFCQSDTTASNGTHGQTKPLIDFSKTSKFDMIKYHDGRVIEVEVQKISEKFITFNLPNDKDAIDYVDRRKVHAVHFRSGRIEVMSDKATEVRKVKEWDEVKVTYSSEEVKGMLEIKKVDIRLNAQSREHYYKQSTLEASAEIILKKKAALENADFILIIKKQHYRAYGDPPSIYMQGIAYRKYGNQ